MHLLEYFSEWQQFDGLHVTVNGTSYVIEVLVIRDMIAVYASPTNKSTTEYRAIRDQLHGDWSTDVLGSEDFTAPCLLACREAREKVDKQLAR